jgi:RNA polymerase sigma factor (sigma-70 family)
VGSVAAETTGEAQLYERNSDLVYRYCLRMLRSREDAEDAAQTTFFQAVRALRRGVVPTFEQAWLLKIASNECKSRHRAGFRRSQRELTRDPQSLEELAEAPNGGDGRLIGVRQALSQLPETQRRALLLREWQGRSYAEIAHELGVSRPAVEALLFRARRGLARELGEETKERRHAFDLASLLAALKSVLGGGAAVKVAAGVAAVATVGTVSAGTRQEAVPLVRVPDAAGVQRSDSPPFRPGAGAAVVVAKPSRAKREAAKAAKAVPAAPGKPVRRAAKPAPSVAAPSAENAPNAPGAEQSAPQPAQAEAPATTPVQAPSLPAVPQVPISPPPAPPPAISLPEVPPLPPVQVPQVQVPQVQVPSVPLPQVPAVPLPDVPDLPIVGDVPILP